jgi:hypothetical protein
VRWAKLRKSNGGGLLVSAKPLATQKIASEKWKSCSSPQFHMSVSRFGAAALEAATHNYQVV